MKQRDRFSVRSHEVLKARMDTDVVAALRQCCQRCGCMNHYSLFLCHRVLWHHRVLRIYVFPPRLFFQRLAIIKLEND